ncbi:efflux RND transporter periplasmic adaptor subunit [Nitrospirillum pindoramense]|uniref:RND family efflux transporter MFP subunit n=1 Tax=Nitrospirillum amazonense TaxID=28077 RepID=A0A560GT96_9PROT|nr:efflux RND transporter periplasmic adaptor subunit [Nitrospirillum amazonense]TWB37236.1 RND family efflux transporter MFP subunit [Nitrospirillum amazonense]
MSRSRSRLILSALFAFGLAIPAQGADTTPEIRAQLVPKRSTVLSSQIAAQISELPLREGDSFSEGQKLVAFDCGIQRARLAKANAQETATRKTYEVKSKLNTLNSIGVLEVETAAAEHAMAEAEQQMAREIAAHCVVTAPFAGRVGPVEVKRFQSVAEGQKLLEILDPTELEAEMLVPSSWLKWLKPGFALEIGIEETGRKYPAKVSRLSPRIDPVSQSIRVFAVIDGKFPDLLPGMSGRALVAAPN